jgi:uncharacterized protein (DUF58 family)
MSLQLLALLTAAAGMGMLALTHNAAAQYFMFSVLVALLLVSYATSRLSTRALRLRRRTTSRVFENEPLSVHLDLVNRGRLPRFLLDLNDSLPEFVQSDGERDFVIPSLWPAERVTLSYTARALKRGVYQWDPLRISASDPFGVFPRSVSFDAPAEAVVYPRPVELRGGLARPGVEARAQSSGERARGAESGLDFSGIREYWPGDDLRRIHWPATAHHGKLTVIEFDRGASDNIAVVLDTSQGSEFGSGLDTTLEVGVRAAASLAHWALRSDGMASLAAAFPDGPRWVSVDQPHREHEILELLARLQADAALPPSALLSWAAGRLASDASIVVITALPDDALPGVIASLVRNLVSVSVLLLHPSSSEPSIRSGSPRAQSRGDPRPPDVTALADQIRAAGARVTTLRRDDSLAEALADVIAHH